MVKKGEREQFPFSFFIVILELFARYHDTIIMYDERKQRDRSWK